MVRWHDATRHSQRVGAVARQAHDAGERHWRAVRKIIPYLNKTNNLGLVFGKDDDRKLSVYVDADYFKKDNDRRSVSGVAVMVRGTVMSASSTTQQILSGVVTNMKALDEPF